MVTVVDQLMCSDRSTQIKLIAFREHAQIGLNARHFSVPDMENAFSGVSYWGRVYYQMYYHENVLASPRGRDFGDITP
jgi:hypothetical protein